MDNAITPEFATALESMKEQQKEAIEEVSKSVQLASLAKNEGWKLIEDLIKQQIEVAQFYPIVANQSMEVSFFKMHAFAYMKSFGELLINTVKMAELNELERTKQE